MTNLALITGPVRSGKSRFAERLAGDAGLAVTYVATAGIDENDSEWLARLEHHRARRPAHWTLVETASGHGSDLCHVLRDAPDDAVLLVDSLGTWLADRMSGAHPELLVDTTSLEAALERDCDALIEALVASRATLIVVGEETGWGIVPDHPSGRIFRDVLGRLQQDIAAQAARVYLIVSGIAIDLRAAGTPVAAKS